jgi:hypothetical protein
MYNTYYQFKSNLENSFITCAQTPALYTYHVNNAYFKSSIDGKFIACSKRINVMSNQSNFCTSRCIDHITK